MGDDLDNLPPAVDYVRLAMKQMMDSLEDALRELVEGGCDPDSIRVMYQRDYMGADLFQGGFHVWSYRITFNLSPKSP